MQHHIENLLVPRKSQAAVKVVITRSVYFEIRGEERVREKQLGNSTISRKSTGAGLHHMQPIQQIFKPPVAEKQWVPLAYG